MKNEAKRQSAIKRMAVIEDKFSTYVPPEVQQFYLLQALIVNGVSSYIASHGLYSLDRESCDDGKDLAGFGPLNDFERDCIKYLNEIIDKEEDHYARRKQIGIAGHR
jgi:hypothetical protein